MNQKDQQAAAQAARVIRAARKRRGISQSTIAKALGMTQGAFSKVENAQYILNAREWFEFCNLTQIIPASFQAGYIDNKTPVSVRSAEVEGGFKLPKRYSESAASKVREVRAFLWHFQDQLGAKKLESFLEAKKIDPDFFVDLDNQINLQFIYDLMDAIREKKGFSLKQAEQIAAGFATPGFHGRLAAQYETEMSSMDRVSMLVEQLPYYGANFRYRVDERSSKKVVIFAEPESYWNEFTSEREILTSVCDYKGFAFKSFASLGSRSAHPLHVQHTECVHSGAKRCVFVVKNA